jgi:membrane protein
MSAWPDPRPSSPDASPSGARASGAGARPRLKERAARIAGWRWWRLPQRAITGWSDDRVPTMGAALAYYTVLSIAPLLILLTAVAGILFGRSTAQSAISVNLVDLMGRQGAAALDAMIEAAGRRRGTGLIASGISLVGLLLGAMGVVVELRGAFNVIWKVDPPPGSGFLSLIRERLLSLVLVLALGATIILSLMVSAWLMAFSGYLLHVYGALSQLLWVAHLVLSIAGLTALFALIFKILPDVMVTWQEAWFGAIVTALLFTLGKYAIGYYVTLDFGSDALAGYGAVSAPVIVLLWVYFSAQIVLFGAEVTRAYAAIRRGESAPTAR